MSSITLYQHQLDAYEHSLDHNKFVVLSSMGSGKTITLIEIAKSKKVPALFIVTKATKEKWVKSLKENDCDGVVYTKEEFKKELSSFSNIGGYKTICIDEMQFYGSHKSQLTKTLLKYISFYEPPYIIGATATLYTSTWQCLYSYNLIFGRKLNWLEMQRYFCEQVRMGAIFIWKQKTTQEVQDTIKKMIEDISHIRVVETGNSVWQDVQIPSVRARKDPEETYHDYYKRESRESSKVTKIESIIKKAKTQKGYVICCYYTDEINFLKERFNCPAISGSNPYQMEYQDIDKYPILILQISTSVGFELPHHHTMIFYSYCFSYISYTQACGRISRLNNFKTNTYIRLINTYGGLSKTKSFDEGILANLELKSDFDPDKFYTQVLETT